MYAAAHDYRDNPLLSDREQLVLEYADRFARDHESIDDAFMERLCAALEPVEVLELSVTVARHMGMGRITRVLRLDHDSCPMPGADSGEPGSH